MASSDRELEDQLLEAGNRLLEPPSSVEELLPLLDQIELCLSKVEQSPSKSMLNALSPSINALIADELLRHSDLDVKVAVASCISEITRITAPDAPYDDDQMKDAFQLIVSSFENLFDKSSRSYAKRSSILETVAKVRSCVVMLDLECDELIQEMFQHFLKAVRDFHPDNVLTSMVTIMTLVLEESEDISIELLSPVLASVKKDNEGVPQIARKLGERVLENCCNKLKPYLVQAVKDLGIRVDDYSDIVASICLEAPGSVEKIDLNSVDRGKSGAASEQLDLAADKSKPVMSNGAKTGRQSGKRADRNNKSREGSSLKQSGEKRRRGLGKAVSAKNLKRSLTKDDEKEMLSSSKSSSKPDKEKRVSESPNTNSKRKRTPGKEKESEPEEFGENLVGSRIKVWWPRDRKFYDGVIDSFDPVRSRHKVLYTDGDVEILNLKKQKWETVAGDSGAGQASATDEESGVPAMPRRKKTKLNSKESDKQKELNTSAKKRGVISSGRSKVSAKKFGRDSKDGVKAEGKSTSFSKNTERTAEEMRSSKSKDHTSKGVSTKPGDVDSKTGSKSLNEDPTETPKPSKSKADETSTPKAWTKSKEEIHKAGKSKQETPKISFLLKGKTSNIGGKSGVNGTSKGKSDSSKTKGSGDSKEDPTEGGKRKSPNSSKAQGSDAKSGKKRGRGSKN